MKRRTFAFCVCALVWKCSWCNDFSVLFVWRTKCSISVLFLTFNYLCFNRFYLCFYAYNSPIYTEPTVLVETGNPFIRYPTLSTLVIPHRLLGESIVLIFFFKSSGHTPNTTPYVLGWLRSPLYQKGFSYGNPVSSPRFPLSKKSSSSKFQLDVGNEHIQMTS